ncbi:snRNA-activating complex subunit 4 [Gossypium australe]|uniref:snRNA-activating complex subunit 4 n=1 Tax=Gossypium australe TaxID=47621 RepID=A0A5B6UP08_9ROSI|nr:snRNA-activating complex subunit 4 [Gossypium australe]
MRDTSALLPSSYRHTMKSNKHEADGDRHVDGKNHGAYENTGSGQDKDNSSSGDANADADGMDNGNVNGDARVGVDVDDKVNDRDEEKGDDDVARCVRGKHADCIVVDWLNGEYCFECNSGSGQVLVCSESGCPVALHEACMTWRPMFDDMGKFYCPYCLYKKEVARFKDLTTGAMLARKELSNFICLRRDSRNKEREGETVSMKGASVSTMAREVSCGDCRNGLNDDGKETRHHSQDSTRGVDVIRKEQSNEQNISRAHGFENVRNGEMMEEVEEDSSDSGGDDIGEGQQQKRPSSSSGVGTVEETQACSQYWELVHKFSSQVNKNIPWRKILEHGHPVFHSTRTPVDLKDKWKNIVAKEISKGEQMCLSSSTRLCSVVDMQAVWLNRLAWSGFNNMVQFQLVWSGFIYHIEPLDQPVPC